MNQNDNYYFVNKITHNYKIKFYFVIKKLNQTFIFAVLNDETSIVILFENIDRFLGLTTQDSICRDLIKKNLII